MLSRKQPLKMLSRDRLVETGGQLCLDDIAYSGAAFSLCADKSFSAVIVESGIVTGDYKPLAAPTNGIYRQVDMTEGLLAEMDDNYIFPHETLQPSSNGPFEGVGYYISKSTQEYPAVAEFYFENKLSSETVHWFSNGTMASSPRISKGEFEARFTWYQNNELKSACIIPTGGRWIDSVIDIQFDEIGGHKIVHVSKKYLQELNEILDLFEFFPANLIEKLDLQSS
jgi:hypothetical protein